MYSHSHHLFKAGQELHIPKELWTMVDFLSRHGLGTVCVAFVPLLVFLSGSSQLSLRVRTAPY